MKTFYFIFLCYLPVVAAHAQTIPSNGLWQLEWEDNFNGTELNDQFWKADHYVDGAGGTSFDNAELNYRYNAVSMDRPENLEVGNGVLRLSLLIENGGFYCPSNYLDEWHCKKQWATGSGYAFTTANISTRMTNFKYGYMEARMKVPYSFGNWPAFWTYRNSFIFTNHSEIDVFEMDVSKGQYKMPTNLHINYNCAGMIECAPGSYECPQYPCYGKDVNVPEYANVWRVYGLEWSPDFIRWYVDGVMVREVQNTTSTSNDGINDAGHIILGLGVHPHQKNKALLLANEYPANMYIDYVRYYVPKFDCETEINACSYNFANYDNQVKQAIKIGGSGCSNTVPAGSHIKLMAESVTINGTFSVPLGAELSIFGQPCYETSEISAITSTLSAKLNNNQQLQLSNGAKYELWPGNGGSIQNWGIGEVIYVYPANNISGTYNHEIYHTGYWAAGSVLAKKIN